MFAEGIITSSSWKEKSFFMESIYGSKLSTLFLEKKCSFKKESPILNSSHLSLNFIFNLLELQYVCGSNIYLLYALKRSFQSPKICIYTHIQSNGDERERSYTFPMPQIKTSIFRLQSVAFKFALLQKNNIQGVQWKTPFVKEQHDSPQKRWW